MDDSPFSSSLGWDTPLIEELVIARRAAESYLGRAPGHTSLQEIIHGVVSNKVSDDNDDDNVDLETMTNEQLREYHAHQKTTQKSYFDDLYDDEKKNDDDYTETEYLEALKREKEARTPWNLHKFADREELTCIRHEGFRQVDPKHSLVIGGLTPLVTTMGLIWCRLKKHRWHSKILKCMDPLVLSVGWRKF